MQSIRSKISKDKEEALADCISQKLDLKDDSKIKADEYACSIMSSVIRIPSFEFQKIDGFSYLQINTLGAEEDKILHLADKNIWIIPLEDKRIQIMLVPASSVQDSSKRYSLCEQVKLLMKSIDETKI